MGWHTARVPRGAHPMPYCLCFEPAPTWVPLSDESPSRMCTPILTALALDFSDVSSGFASLSILRRRDPVLNLRDRSRTRRVLTGPVQVCEQQLQLEAADSCSGMSSLICRAPPCVSVVDTHVHSLTPIL